MEVTKSQSKKQLTPEEVKQRKEFIAAKVAERTARLTDAGYDPAAIATIVNYSMSHRGYSKRHEGDAMVFWMTKLPVFAARARDFNQETVTELTEALKVICDRYTNATEDPSFTDIFERRNGMTYVLSLMGQLCRDQKQTRYMCEAILELLTKNPNCLEFKYHEESPEAREERLARYHRDVRHESHHDDDHPTEGSGKREPSKRAQFDKSKSTVPPKKSSTPRERKEHHFRPPMEGNNPFAGLDWNNGNPIVK